MQKAIVNDKLINAAISGNMDAFIHTNLTPMQATKLLHIAALHDQVQVVSLMIERDAYDFKTAYMNACENGNVNIRKYIVGVIMRHVRSLGKAAKPWAYGYLDVVVAYGLMGACKGGHVDRVKIFLIDPKIRLYVDCMCNCCNINPNIEIVRMIIRYESNRLTPAHILCEKPNCNHLRDTNIAAMLLPLLEKMQS